MSHGDSPASTALLEDSSEEELRELLIAGFRKEVAASRTTVGVEDAVRIVAYGLLQRSFPSLAGCDVLAKAAAEVAPILLSHQSTRLRLERLLHAVLPAVPGLVITAQQSADDTWPEASR